MHAYAARKAPALPAGIRELLAHPFIPFSISAYYIPRFWRHVKVVFNGWKALRLFLRAACGRAIKVVGCYRKGRTCQKIGLPFPLLRRQRSSALRSGGLRKQMRKRPLMRSLSVKNPQIAARKPPIPSPSVLRIWILQSLTSCSSAPCGGRSDAGKRRGDCRPRRCAHGPMR